MESLAYDSDPKQEKYVKGLNALGNSRKHIPVVLLEHKISAAGWILSWWITAFPPEKR